METVFIIHLCQENNWNSSNSIYVLNDNWNILNDGFAKNYTGWHLVASAWPTSKSKPPTSITIMLTPIFSFWLAGESGAESVNTEIFPAAMKVSMRLHIRRLCATPHCTQTLVLYLNSPSKTDGTMLLWDVNKNGKVRFFNVLIVHCFKKDSTWIILLKLKFLNNTATKSSR